MNFVVSMLIVLAAGEPAATVQTLTHSAAYYYTAGQTTFETTSYSSRTVPDINIIEVPCTNTNDKVCSTTIILSQTLVSSLVQTITSDVLSITESLYTTVQTDDYPDPASSTRVVTCSIS